MTLYNKPGVNTMDKIIEEINAIDDRISQIELKIIGLKERKELLEEMLQKEQDKKQAEQDIAWRQMKL
jgi:hypothetical protein